MTLRILAFFLIFMAGCATRPSALELINLYGCGTCKPEECNLCQTYNDGTRTCFPCPEDEYNCCKEVVPVEHQFIFDCAYEPLFV